MRVRTVGAAALVAAVVAAGASGRGPTKNGLVAFNRCCGPGATGIYVIRPDGSGETRIFAPKADDAPLTPAWSANGKQIAFVPGAPTGGLWVMQANGTASRQASVTHSSRAGRPTAGGSSSRTWAARRRRSTTSTSCARTAPVSSG